MALSPQTGRDHETRFAAVLHIEVPNLAFSRDVWLGPSTSRGRLSFSEFLWWLAEFEGGWNGTVEWVNTSGTVVCEATHDDSGLATLKVTAASTGQGGHAPLNAEPGTWMACAAIEIAAEDLSRNARFVSSFVLRL